MPITRTVNYTQNVPASLGFSNYINPSPSRNIRVTFNFITPFSDGKMGKITFPEVANVQVFYGLFSTDPVLNSFVSITGPVVDVNTALNGAEYINNFYQADTVEQDFLSQNPILPNDKRGELCIQIPAGTVHGLAVGSECCISTVTNANSTSRFVVTAIDETNSPTRLWLLYNPGYDIADKFFSGEYKNAAIGAYLQTTARVNIAPINDVSYNNPHGTFTSVTTIRNIDTSTDEETGTITYVGDFFVPEPEFTIAPPATISATTPNIWHYSSAPVEITQTDDNFQSVQYLIKCLENDPMYLGVSSYTSLPGYPSGGTEAQKLQFIGDAIDAKASKDTPTYITDDTYGLFGNVQFGQRVSTSYSSGVVRWAYYDVASNCSKALSTFSYFRPPNFNKDFTLETRIVNGRTRIYSTRGK